MNAVEQIAAFLGALQDGLGVGQLATAARIQFPGAADAEITGALALTRIASSARSAQADAHLRALTALAANLHEEPWGQ